MRKLSIIMSVLFLLSSIISLNSLYAGAKDPVAVLYQVKGDVKYTRNGKKWKKVRRNKFLFSGYKIKTGENGSGMITNQKTGKNLALNPSSIIAIEGGKLIAQKGELGATADSSKLLTGLMRRFTKSQSYTTVRRAAKKKSDKMKVVRNIVLSEDYPHLVWPNYGSDLSYLLMIGEDKYEIPASSQDIIKVKIKPFTGRKNFQLKAQKEGKEILTLKQYKRNNYLIKFLTQKEQDKLNKELQTISENYPDNSFMLGSLYEKKKIWVAAMDQYKKYLNDNPEEIEMTPYLFKVYKKLKLEKTWKEELAQFKSNLLE